MVTIDTSTEFGERVERHLVDDRIVWLSTADPDGTPQPSPVWFLWDGDTVLMYSQPNTPKVRNIEANPQISLHFNCNENGGDVIIMTAEAQVDDDTPPASDVVAYIEKYTEGLNGISMSPQNFSAAYSVPIRARLTSLRGH